MAQDGQIEAANFIQLTNTLLNGKKYVSWARATSRALSGREILDYINGQNKKPEAADLEKLIDEEKWQQNSGDLQTI